MTKPRVFALLGTLASISFLCHGASFAQWYNPFGDKDGDGCGSWDITCNPNVKPITKPIAEDLWGEAGQSAYKAASEIMYRTNGSAQALDYEQKRWLRPLHGSLVDRVSVIYNSRMMERWGIPGTGKDVVLNSPFPVIEAVTDSLGNKASNTNYAQTITAASTVRVGDELEIRVFSTDPLGGQLEFSIARIGPKEWSPSNARSIRFTEADIGRACDINVMVRSTRPYHAYSDFDDYVMYRYVVLPLE